MRLISLALISLAGSLLLPAVPLVAQQPSPPAIEALTRDLLEGNRDQRREAAFQLSRMGPQAAPAVDALIQALNDRDQQVWFYAVDALANIGPAAAAATDALIRDLGRGGRQRWYRSAYALGRIGEAAVPKLLAVLEDKNERVRAGAALAFSFQPNLAAAAADKLARLLTDPSEAVRHQAVLALSAAGDRSLDAVVSYLEHENPLARAAALEVLSRVRPNRPDLVERIVKLAASDQPASVRAAALTCLAEVRPDLNPAVRSAVVSALRSEEEAVRFAAMDVVVAYGERGPELVRAVARLVVESEPDRRRELAALLERLGPAAVDATRELVQGYLAARTGGERDALADAIVAIGQPALETLVTTIGELGAKGADLVPLLVRFGPAATAAIVELASSSVPELRAAALRSLSRVEGDITPARDAILRAAHDADPAVRAAGLTALAGLVKRGLVSRTQAARLALEALSSEDADVQRAAIRGAILWAQPQEAAQVARRALDRQSSRALKLAVFDALIQRRLTTAGLFSVAAKQVPEANDPAVTRAALAYLTNVPPERPDRRALREALAAAVQHADPQVRQAAVELLSAYRDTIGLAHAGQVIAELLQDRSAPVRARALQALRQLARQPIDDEDLVTAVTAALRDESESVRQAAAQAVSRVMPRQRAVRALAEALDEEPSWAVRKVIYLELAAFGADAAPAMPVILKRLLTTRDDMSDTLRAIRQIRTVTPEARPVLLELLQQRDPTKRVTAAVLLSQLKDVPSSPRVIAALESALQLAPDPLKPRVREALERARQASGQQ